MDVVAKTKEILKEEGHLVFLTKFGSHLYGTNTEMSDTDYKGIYVPFYRNLILGNAKETIHHDTKNGHGEKNTKDDVDIELMSIGKFMRLLRAGETTALDMVHANKQNIVYAHDSVTTHLLAFKEMFYTKNLKAFVGYARKQAAKYGLKGSRLDVIKSVIAILSVPKENLKMKVVWDDLPVGEHSRFTDTTHNGIRQYEICGKTLQDSMTVGYAQEILLKYYESYGARAILAQKNEGVDWKAISHAFRAAFQVKDIFTKGGFSFPLEEAAFLRDVKLGKFAYVDIADKLESLIEEVEYLSSVSTLREEVPKGYADNFVLLITTKVNGMWV